MAIKVGLVGLPNVGKSTLFNVLTGGNSPVGNFPFTTKTPHIGACPIPDQRLQRVADFFQSQTVTPARVEVVDIAGLVKGAAHGEGLGNQFLSHIREVDVIVHVLRTFDDPSVSVALTAQDELEVVKIELMLSDLQMLTRRRQRIQSSVKARNKKALAEQDTIDALIKLLEQGMRADTEPELCAEQNLLTPLLTAKPAFVVANTDGSCAAQARIDEISNRYEVEVVSINAQLALEILSMPTDDRDVFQSEIDDVDSKLIVDQALDSANRISFFTGNRNETTAWLVEPGSSAHHASGKIHSEMQQGFIACEVAPWNALVPGRSWSHARAQGMVRTEGAGYIVKDGDVLLVKFSPPRRRRT